MASDESSHGQPTALPRVFLSRREAAETYAISVWAVDELVAAGEVRAKRLGRRILVYADSMRAWADRLDDA